MMVTQMMLMQVEAANATRLVIHVLDQATQTVPRVMMDTI